jgi:hypothetical protein
MSHLHLQHNNLTTQSTGEGSPGKAIASATGALIMQKMGSNGLQGE